MPKDDENLELPWMMCRLSKLFNSVEEGLDMILSCFVGEDRANDIDCSIIEDV